LLEPPDGIGQMPSGSLVLACRFPPYLVLLRVGFTLPPSLLMERCAFTAPFHPYPGAGTPPVETGEPGAARRPKSCGLAEAVFFLWHWPSTSLEARIPDVIRHTALRSSDFPPPEFAEAESGSDRPVLLPASVYRLGGTVN